MSQLRFTEAVNAANGDNAAAFTHMGHSSLLADGLTALPRDYTGIPRDVTPLGPPLPFGLGGLIVAAQNQAGLVIDAEQQRLNQETEAARPSKVFTSTNVSAAATRDPAAAAAPSTAAASDETFAQNG